MKENLESYFGEELLDYREIPALSKFTVHSGSFSPDWNRDFRDPGRS
jgi:hypothetical protein